MLPVAKIHYTIHGKGMIKMLSHRHSSAMLNEDLKAHEHMVNYIVHIVEDFISLTWSREKNPLVFFLGTLEYCDLFR